jgi:hypothetical protein
MSRAVASLTAVPTVIPVVRSWRGRRPRVEVDNRPVALPAAIGGAGALGGRGGDRKQDQRSAAECDGVRASARNARDDRCRADESRQTHLRELQADWDPPPSERTTYSGKRDKKGNWTWSGDMKAAFIDGVPIAKWAEQNAAVEITVTVEPSGDDGAAREGGEERGDQSRP